MYSGFPDSSAGKESTCNAGDPHLIPGSGRVTGEEIGYPYQYSWASLVAQLVNNPPAMWETWVQSLGWENPLKKGKATHSSILAQRIPWTIHSMELQRVRHDWATLTFICIVIILKICFSSVQSLSHVRLFATPQTAAHQASLSITNSQSLPKLMSIELVMPSSISPSVVPFSSCPQSFPAPGSFQMSQLFSSGGQSIEVWVSGNWWLRDFHKPKKPFNKAMNRKRGLLVEAVSLSWFPQADRFSVWANIPLT